jgi:hypothetical protein
MERCQAVVFEHDGGSHRCPWRGVVHYIDWYACKPLVCRHHYNRLDEGWPHTFEENAEWDCALSDTFACGSCGHPFDSHWQESGRCRVEMGADGCFCGGYFPAEPTPPRSGGEGKPCTRIRGQITPTDFIDMG